MQSAKGESWNTAFEKVGALTPVISATRSLLVFVMVSVNLPSTGTRLERHMALRSTTPMKWPSVSFSSATQMNTASLLIGLYSRPMLRPNLFRTGSAPEEKDLGRNGTYLVLRQFDQDVGGSGNSSRSIRGGLAEAISSPRRWSVVRAGDPLVPSNEPSPAPSPDHAKSIHV